MDVKKKVTFIISSLAGGGAEGVCVNIANGLTEEGWEVNLVVLHLNNASYQDKISSKVNLVVLGVNHARYASLALLKYIYKYSPSIVLVFNYELAVMLVILRSLFRFKAKIFTRNINTLSQNQFQAEGFWLKYVVIPLIDKLYNKVDHIINQCEAMRDDLVSLYPHLSKKTSVIYNPVAKHIEDFAKSFDFNNLHKQDYILCVGRLEKQKAFHHAIKAFAFVANDFPNLRLKIVGKGSLELYLKQFAFDLGIEERVDFEGFQKDLIPYYLHAKTTLLTSLYEGFPNVLLESICLGTPVVAFDCPSGPNEIIVTDKNGYLVKDKCLNDLNDKLKLTLDKNWKNSIILETAKPYNLSNLIYKYEYFFNQY